MAEKGSKAILHRLYRKHKKTYWRQ